VVDALALEAERQATLERLGVAFGDELVLGGTTLLLRALGGKQVTEAGRAANELTSGGELEALGDGLFGLLHGGSGRKQGVRSRLARAILNETHSPRGMEAIGCALFADDADELGGHGVLENS
jgi:hypothetical protein